MKQLMFFDSTLRDGSHAIQHQLSLLNIEDYCKEADTAGFHTIIVGHGNGLGASSLQVGLSLCTDRQMLTTAKKQLKKTKLGVFLIPGFGTITNDLKPALEIGVDLVCVASHCTEADVTRQHIEYIRSSNKDAYGVLMSSHMASADKLVSEAIKMQEYGALGIILMDSAGASTPDSVTEKVQSLVNSLKIPVGYHAHNNLGLAVYNSFAAIQAGATIIDGTVRGFGAGAGNCQLEVLVGLLEMYKIKTPVNLYKTMDISEKIILPMMQNPQGISALSLISGITGVFSAFAPHVKKAADKFNIDPRDIFIELGKRKVVGGQEDMIIDVAMNLSQMAKKDNTSYDLESLL
jgi:4-hydroxy 2-oxovalerate aldolase